MNEEVTQEVTNAMQQMQALTDKAYALGLEYAPRLALAIITLIIGLWLIGLITKGLRLSMEKSHMNPTLIPFLRSLASWTLKLLLFISVASMIGIATTSFIAVLGAAGLAIGLAMQGSLANFAGGVLIMIFKPYKIGDVIEAQGHVGVVKEVQIFNTIITSPQNRRIIIPNGAMSNGSITNFNVEEHVRVDMSLGIGYDADISKAKSLVMDLLTKDDRVLEEPAPLVAVSELADSSVNLVIRAYTKPSDYWGVFFAMNESMKLAMDENGINIPFPQRDIHMVNA